MFAQIILIVPLTFRWPRGRLVCIQTHKKYCRPPRPKCERAFVPGLLRRYGRKKYSLDPTRQTRTRRGRLSANFLRSSKLICITRHLCRTRNKEHVVFCLRVCEFGFVCVCFFTLCCRWSSLCSLRFFLVAERCREWDGRMEVLLAREP